ncbi:MAG: tRNA 2-thiouridine(34) synthase MnmA [Desulfobacterales bacterium]|jgi:tRNA-specific 2-thiouridylase
MKLTTAVAISGGVDSMMAAYALKQQGHHVIGIHFLTGFETPAHRTKIKSKTQSHPIIEIGNQVGISIRLFDCRHDFKTRVIDYFIQTYLAGQTPNPCMVCNPAIKFGSVLAYARKLGADQLATGHYAQIKRDSSGSFHLHKGIDRHKDQSYFLARLTQNQLAQACFPLGDMKKSEVQQLAEKKGLHPITSKESQDACFVKQGSYGEFLLKQSGYMPAPGPIVDRHGTLLGQHKGLHLFTIGQRRGINCPAPEPYYVVKLDRKRNRLVVGSKSDLLTSTCRVVDINWITDPPTAPITVHTRIRYRHQGVAGTLFPKSNNSAEIQFKSPQAAITPGQGAVFYQGDEVLGGGWLALDT